MAEHITHTWQTVEQAAVTMNVSTRTIARRLANGSLESRVDENGRRLVLVQQVHAAQQNQADAAGNAKVSDGDTVDEYVNTHLSAMSSAMTSAMNDALPTAENRQPQTLAVLNVLETTLMAARQDASTARRSARWAWAGVGLMVAAVLAGTAVVSSVLTKATVQRDMLGNQLAETKTELQQTQAQLIATRSDQAVTARDLAEAKKTNDDLKATALARPAAPVVVAVTPTTKPSAASLKSRLAALWGD